MVAIFGTLVASVFVVSSITNTVPCPAYILLVASSTPTPIVELFCPSGIDVTMDMVEASITCRESEFWTYRDISGPDKAYSIFVSEFVARPKGIRLDASNQSA